jgi:Outer membrane protein beta-barrel domain
MENRYRIVALAVLTLFFTQSIIFAQKRLEVGPAIGISFYQGDVLGTSIPEISQNINLMGGIHAGYYFNNFMGVHLEVQRGKISGGDQYAEFPERRLRNLSFESPVTNANIRFDWEITGYNPNEDRNFSLYGFVGGGMIFFNPKATYQGKTYRLQPLGTEGQGLAKYPDRKPYKLNTPNLQVGGGLKFAITPNINAGVEFSAYRTFTDYLDDVAGNYVPYTDILAEKGDYIAAALSNREGEYLKSDQIILKAATDTRGNEKVFDYYYTTTLKVTYNFYSPFAKKGAKRFSKFRNVKKCYKF